jgi:hypothetical protein
MKKKFEMGQEVMYKGVLHNIVAQRFGQWGIVPKKTFQYVGQTYNVLLVPAEAIQPIASDVFAVGDEVRRINGTFEGKVTGFEHESNRIVCVSNRIGNYLGKDADRTRYAYLPSDLEIIPQEPVFKSNHIYTIKFANEFKSRKVRVLPHADMVSVYVLYGAESGKVLTTVPKDTYKEDLIHFGITQVK